MWGCMAGTSQFKSTQILTPDLQFTSRNIKFNVTLNDAGGNNLAVNLPTSCKGVADSV